MKHNKPFIWFITLVTSAVLLNTGNGVNAQEQPLFSKEQQEQARKTATQPITPALLGCRGPITQVIDVGYEDVKITFAVYGTSPGGGEGQEFDKTPVLSTSVTLLKGACLDAHLSAMVGSKQTYGVSRMTLFQVTLTPATGAAPKHMFGQYERPFGLPAPAVALEAERDVDMYASNFFQRVGNGPHDVPPGTYRVDVWWAGGPPPPPGGPSAIGAAFVLKLYLR
jgi:hypothetical protein